MKKWADVKKTITSISDSEKANLEDMAAMVAKIIERRKALGWSQEELANAAGLKQSAISRIENAASIPNITTISKISSALNLRMQLVETEESEA